MHPNSELVFERYAKPHFHSGQRVLEIGPDGDPSTYRRALESLELHWETADLADGVRHELAGVDAFVPFAASQHVMPNEYEIPTGDDTFDVVLAGQVAEHVRRLWAWVQELARVTKPGGKVIVISPISWPYHEAPVDCWRIYPEGMRALCSEASLSVLLCEMAALEPKSSRRQYYGTSTYWPSSSVARSLAKAALRIVRSGAGYRTSTALDLVTVAQKPLSTSGR